MESSVLQFVNNFTTALNPQITKSYANGELGPMYALICRGAKFSYFSILAFSLPIILEANQILGLWLVDVPDYTVIFVQLSLIMGMCDCIGTTGYTACIATGRMKRYSLTITPLIILEFPLTWLLFLWGAPVTSTYFLYIVIKILVLFVRMYLMQKMIGLMATEYIKKVFVPISITTIVALVLPTVLVGLMEENIYRLVILLFVTIFSVTLSSLVFGMTRNERSFILQKCANILFKK